MIPDTQAGTLLPRSTIQKTALRIGDGVVAGLFWIQAALLVGLFVTTIVLIFYRFVLNRSLSFSNDLLILLFTWLIFLGIPGALWKDNSPRIVLLRSRETDNGVLGGFAWGVTLAYLIYVLASVRSLLPVEQTTVFVTLGLSRSWAGLAVETGAVLGTGLLLLRLAATPRLATHLLGGAGGVVAAALLLASPVSPVVTLVVGVLGLLLLGVPIAVALGMAGGAMVLNGNLANLPTPAQQLVQGPANIALIAIPLFMFMGAMVSRTRLAQALGELIRSILGWLPGGTGVAAIGSSAIFANMSGSAIADTAAIGTIFIPRMVASGEFAPEEAAALQSAAGVVGVLFPPAVALILFATVSSVSVIAVFKAALIPGGLVVLAMTTVTIVRALRKGLQTASFHGRAVLRSIPPAIPILLIPVILDVGILSGVFTPAESGAVAILVTLAILTAMKGIRLSELRLALQQSLENTIMTLFILVNVSILDWGVTTSNIASGIQALLGTLHSGLVALVVVNVILLFIHGFVETAPAILLMVPLVLPALTPLGVNPLQLAAVVAVNSTIGLMLPPVGVSLFVSSRIADVPVKKVVRHALPYVVASLAVLAAVTFIPSLSLWLAQG